MKIDEAERIAHHLLPLMRMFCGEHAGIALGGSCAKGTSDQVSDIDIYVFSETVKPNEERAELTHRFIGNRTNHSSWGQVEPFSQAGTDFEYEGFKIECWMRNAQNVERSLFDNIAGRISCQLVTWTPNGFHSHCLLSDVNSLRVLADPHGKLSSWKEAVRQYPAKLQQAIIGQHLEAAKFWPNNFHYGTAIQRVDLLYTASIVQQVVHNLIQVIFAINKTYFPGDKNILSAMKYLEFCPDHFTESIRGLLFPAAEPSALLLEGQRLKIIDLVEKVSDLADQHY